MLIAVSMHASDINIPQMTGRWVNVDANSVGILEVIIEVELDGMVPRHRFYWVGNTSPEPTKYTGSFVKYFSESVSDKNIVKAMANHQTSFSNIVYTITQSSNWDGRELIIDSYTEFTDNSRRSNYISHGIFRLIK